MECLGSNTSAIRDLYIPPDVANTLTAGDNPAVNHATHAPAEHSQEVVTTHRLINPNGPKRRSVCPR